MIKNYFKQKDPYKPKIWENKNFIYPDENDISTFLQLYNSFLTNNYDDILVEFNNNIILNDTTEEGKTLIIAVLTNDELNELQKKYIIDKLINRKVSINAKDQFNQTALHLACKLGYNSIIKLLIDKEAIKDDLDNYGNAPVHYYIDNFVKECQDYDIYNPKTLLINPKNKKYSDIIENIFTLKIIDFMNNDQCQNNIKNLIKLIKFFEIKKIQDEYDIFIKNYKFNNPDEILYPDKKNKIFKSYIQFKNNIHKIFEEKNRFESIDSDAINTVLIEYKRQNETNIKDASDNIEAEIKKIVEKLDKIKKPFDSITETLFLLIFIKKTLPFSINKFKNNCIINITKNCKVIYDKIKDILKTNLVENIDKFDDNEINSYYSKNINYENDLKKVLDLLILAAKEKNEKRQIKLREYLEDIRAIYNKITTYYRISVDIKETDLYQDIVCYYYHLNLIKLDNPRRKLYDYYEQCQKQIVMQLSSYESQNPNLKKDLFDSIIFKSNLPYYHSHTLLYKTVISSSSAAEMLIFYNFNTNVITRNIKDNYKFTKKSILNSAYAVYYYSKFITKNNDSKYNADAMARINRLKTPDIENYLNNDKCIGYFSDIKKTIDAIFDGDIFLKNYRSSLLDKISVQIQEEDERNEKYNDLVYGIAASIWCRTIAIIFNLLGLSIKKNDEDIRQLLLEDTVVYFITNKDLSNIFKNIIIVIGRAKYLDDRLKIIFQAAILGAIVHYRRIVYAQQDQDTYTDDVNDYDFFDKIDYDDYLLINMYDTSDLDPIQLLMNHTYLFLKHALAASIISAYVANSVYELYSDYNFDIRDSDYPDYINNLSTAVKIAYHIGRKATFPYWKKNYGRDTLIDFLSKNFETKITLSSILNLLDFRDQDSQSLNEELCINLIHKPYNYKEEGEDEEDDEGEEEGEDDEGEEILGETQIPYVLKEFFNKIIEFFPESTLDIKSKIMTAIQEALYIAVPFYESESTRYNVNSVPNEHIISAILSSACYSQENINFYYYAILRKEDTNIDECLKKIIDKILFNYDAKMEDEEISLWEDDDGDYYDWIFDDNSNRQIYSSELRIILERIILGIEQLNDDYSHENSIKLRDYIYQIREILKHLSFFIETEFLNEDNDFDVDEYQSLMDCIPYLSIANGNSLIARIDCSQKGPEFGSLKTIIVYENGEVIWPDDEILRNFLFPNNITKLLSNALSSKDENVISQRLLDALTKIYEASIIPPPGKDDDGNTPRDKYTGRGIISNKTVLGFDNSYFPIFYSNEAYNKFFILKNVKLSIQNLEKARTDLESLLPKINKIDQTNTKLNWIVLKNIKKKYKIKMGKMFTEMNDSQHKIIYYDHLNIWEKKIIEQEIDYAHFLFDNICSEYFKKNDCYILIDKDIDVEIYTKPIRFHDNDKIYNSNNSDNEKKKCDEEENKRSEEGREEGSEKGSEEGREEGSEEGSEEEREEGSEKGSEEGREEGSEEGSEEEREEGSEHALYEKKFIYKFFNIHIIFELITNYLDDIKDIKLPNIITNYYENINYDTILKIYSNYEKIICIINNLNVIYKKIEIINDAIVNSENFRNELVKEEYFNNEFELTLFENIPVINTQKRSSKKKKYKIIQKGGNNYNNYIKLIESLNIDMKKKKKLIFLFLMIYMIILKIY